MSQGKDFQYCQVAALCVAEFEQIVIFWGMESSKGGIGKIKVELDDHVEYINVLSKTSEWNHWRWWLKQQHMFEKICQTVNMQSLKRVRMVTWEWREKEMEKVKWTPHDLFFYFLSISFARDVNRNPNFARGGKIKGWIKFSRLTTPPLPFSFLLI